MSLWLMSDFCVAPVLSRLRWPDLANCALPPSALGDVFLDAGKVVFVEAPAKELRKETRFMSSCLERLEDQIGPLPGGEKGGELFGDDGRVNVWPY